jgi:hypothetical protein
VDTLLKEKKCKNCILCIEDLKGGPSDAIVKDLNDRLVTKSAKIADLEDQLRKSSSLQNQISSHSFNLIRQKT